MDQKFQIILQETNKSFNYNKSIIKVLKDVSVSFKKGHTYAITGASGSGKSTLLHLIAGLDLPTSGSVLINGVSTADLSLVDRAKQIGLVFQYPYLIKELSVLENIMLAGQLVNLPEEETKRLALAALVDVDLEQVAEWNIGQLSGGQRQRVTLARALMNKPAFLVADELTGNVDEQTGKKILEILFSCQKKWGMGLIVSTHNNLIADMMEQVYILKDGQLKSR